MKKSSANTLAHAASAADELVGRVVAIADGDTLTVLVSRKQIKVRLLDIDAPSANMRSALARGNPLRTCPRGAMLRCSRAGKDRYGSTLGRVLAAA